MSVRIHRGFVATGGGRRVHYRGVGSGPPLVMLHGSPGDSEMLLHEMAAASAHFSVIALDTPGFGFSEALPGEELSVRDLAAATAEAMTALALPPCRVYGNHTGAAIGVELGVGWPGMVSGLLLEGLPIFTPEEIDILFRGYFAPMVPDPLGGHLTSTWMRFRDQFTWFPWTSRDVTRLNPYGRPTPEDIHHWVSMFYRGCKTYGPAYRAACTYGRAALRAAEALTVPALFTATETDMLHQHLQRLPLLRQHQRVVPLPTATAQKNAALVEYVQELPGAGSFAPTACRAPIGSDPGLMFVTVDNVQLLVRTYGNAAHPALMIAHDAPGSGLACESLARILAERFHVIVPDLPGCGESLAPETGAAILQFAAAGLSAIADSLDLCVFSVLGIGCGAAVAAVMADGRDSRVRTVLLEAPPMPDEAKAAAIAPDLPLSSEGAHWLRAWLMVRDGQIYQPWFDGSVLAQRRRQGNFDAQWLHDQTCALMAARNSYYLIPRAAWRFDTDAALHHAVVPVQVLSATDRVEQIVGILIPEAISA